MKQKEKDVLTEMSKLQTFFKVLFYVELIAGIVFIVKTTIAGMEYSKGRDSNYGLVGFIYSTLLVAFIFSVLFGVYKLLGYVKSLQTQEMLLTDDKTTRTEKEFKNNSWYCSCGRRNPNYVGTCACGKLKP